MIGLKEYYRPQALDEALRLLQHEGTLPLAGGHHLTATGQHAVRAVVDLQALGLDSLSVQETHLHIGSMVRLQQLAESTQVGALLAEAVHHEGSLTYRNAVTIGGTIVTRDPVSCVLLSLLVLDAQVQVRRADGSITLRLDSLLDAPTAALKGGLIIDVSFPQSEGMSGTAVTSVARTPRDKPIVVVVVRIERQGNLCRDARIALGGVAGRPLRAYDAERRLAGRVFGERLAEEVATAAIASLDPPSDFRGSGEYRREMAAVLIQRALLEAWAK
jgi:probable selenate reductase FAD-binding subunit